MNHKRDKSPIQSAASNSTVKGRTRGNGIWVPMTLHELPYKPKIYGHSVSLIIIDEYESHD